MLSKVALLTLLALSIVSCSGDAPEVVVAPSVAEIGDHPADAIAAARYLPHATPLLVMTDHLSEALADAGRGELITRFRKQYEEAAFSMVRELGYNVMSPEALADLGIDVEGQTGVALYAERTPEPRFVIFFTLHNPERFKNLAYMVANGHVGRKRMAIHVARDGVVVGRKEIAVAILGRVGMVVLGSDALRVGKNLAALEPEESLMRHRPFRVAMRPTRAAGVYGYFDLRAALFQQARLDPRWEGTTADEAKADIERLHRSVLAGARSRGLDASDLVAIDARYEQARARLGDGAFARRMRSLFGALGGGGFSVRASPTGVDVTAELDIAPRALFQKLLRPRQTAPPLLPGLAEVPAAMVGASLDLPTLGKLARDFEAPIAELNVLIGADLETDLLPLLSGEIAALVGPPKEGLAAVRGLRDLSLAALIGVADAKRVDEILTQFTDRGDGTSVLQADGARKWKMKLPDVAPLSVRLTDRHIIVATDDGLAARLDGKTKRPQGPRAWQLVSGKGQAVELFVDLPALFAANLGVFELPATHERTRLPWHDPQAPKSAAYTAKLDELNALEATVAKLSAQQAERARSAQLAAAKPLGAAGLTLTPTEHGVRLAASYRTTGRSIASVVAGLLKLRDQKAVHEDDAKLAELEKKRGTLEAELDAIYEKDNPQTPPPAPQ